MNLQPQNLYQIYNKRRSELLALAKNQANIIDQIKMDDIQREGTKQGDVVKGLVERLSNDKLRVLIVGRFSAGKSTFINALIGETLLPATPTPTTGVLCQIAYAEEQDKRVTLYPKEDTPGGAQPFDISVEALEDYIKIDHIGEAETEVTSKYKRMELFWPLDLCKNGVELIDSVGLDDPDSRDSITLDYANSVDAVLYVMKSLDCNSKKDLDTIELLRSLGYQSLFFIITYYDQIKSSAAMGEQSEEEFQEIVYKSLLPLTDLGREGIRFVDSRSALIGRKQGDDAKVIESGIEAVEQSLESFLVTEKGRAKLITTLRSLSAANKAAMQVIPARIDMLQLSTVDLERRYEAAKGPLNLLQTKRKLIISQVESAIVEISDKALVLATHYFSDLPSKLSGWADQYEIEGGIGFPPRKSTLEPLVKEVLNHLKSEIEKDISNWTAESLSPTIEQGVQNMQDTLESEAQDFIQSANRIRVNISIGDHISDEELAKQEEPSVWGRLIAGGYTLLTRDFLTGGMGMVMGIGAMVRTIALQVVAGVLLAVFGLINPFALIAASIGAILAGNVMTMFSLKSDIKKKVAKKMSEELASRQMDLAENVRSSTRTKLEELRDALDAGLSGEISSIEDEVEAVLLERKQGQLDVQSEIQRLRKFQNSNYAIDTRLTDLMFEAGLK